MRVDVNTTLGLSAGILFIASIFSLGYHHLDEHFQLLEFASLKLGLTTEENLPWEYHNQMRPSLQPWIVVGVYKTLGLIEINSPFSIAFVLRLMSASLSLVAMCLVYRTFSQKIDDSILGKWFLLLSFLLWFLLYNGVRFSAENWSGSLFAIAFSLYFLRLRPSAGFFIGIGALMGISFVIRYQAAFLVIGFMSWLLLIEKEKFLRLVYLSIGLLSVILLGVLCDRLFYGEWTIVMWNYFDLNLLQDKVSGFGIDPWWHYIQVFFIKGIPPFSLVFLITVPLFLFFKRKSPVTWTIVPFLFIHFYIGHKELRFLFPIAIFLPFIIIKGIEIVQERYLKSLLSNKAFSLFISTFFIVNYVAILAIVFLPADNRISLYRSIYNQYSEETILYYLDDNPYDRATGINFYKRKNLSFQQLESIDSLPKTYGIKPLLVFKDREAIEGVEAKSHLVYSSFPDWIRYLNFNGWLDRTDAWYVYELREN